MRRLPRASSACSSRHGTSTRAATGWPSHVATDCPPRSASTRTSRARLTRPRGRRPALACHATWVVALGETGLDYDRAFSPRADQLANLRRHIELSLELAQPLILHCRSKPGERDAQDDLIRELREAGVGERCLAGPFRRPAARRPALVQRSRGLRGGRPRHGPRHRLRRPRLPQRRGGQRGRGPHRARGAPPDRDRRPLPQAPRRPWQPQRAPPRGRHRRWLLELRGDDPDAFGAALVAAFDRFVGAGST